MENMKLMSGTRCLETSGRNAVSQEKLILVVNTFTFQTVVRVHHRYLQGYLVLYNQKGSGRYLFHS
jgi:hypothetical protein